MKIGGDWLCTEGDGNFVDGGKATQRSPPDNVTRWIIIQSNDFMRKGTEKSNRSVQTCRSVRTYVYLGVTSQVQERSGTVDAKQNLKSTFNELKNEDYSISVDIERYQSVLRHTLSKVNFSVGSGVYMLPSNLNLTIRKNLVYDNKILMTNIGMNRLE